MNYTSPKPRTHVKKSFDSSVVLNAIPHPIIVVDRSDAVEFVNSAAEQFFDTSHGVIRGRSLGTLLAHDSPIFSLIRQARQGGGGVSEYDISLEMPHAGRKFISAQATSICETEGTIVLSMQETSVAVALDRQIGHVSAARSIAALSAMLAHEVKNPLSGIRGAAQLLEQNASADDRPLTRLICDETDRICVLVDRLDSVSTGGQTSYGPVNIHKVLERVRNVAKAGFGAHVRFIEHYDPSLPAVFGNFDQLVQVFLNLVKNACAAVPNNGGEVTLSTRFQHGVRLAMPGRSNGVNLPLIISVHDNGHGIPEEMLGHVFEPFVTTKSKGSGLGLALVAKIIREHGGMIDVESARRRTLFSVALPMADGMQRDKSSLADTTEQYPS